MITRRSTLPPLTIAMVTAIEGSAALDAILAGDKVYNTIVPPNSPLPYCVLGLAQETSDDLFNEPGNASRQQIHFWGRNALALGNMEMLAIYDALYGLFHEQPIAMTGFSYVIGSLQLIAITEDQDGETLHGIADYAITSRQE